jgi:hypothetical protein
LNGALEITGERLRIAICASIPFWAPWAISTGKIVDLYKITVLIVRFIKQYDIANSLITVVGRMIRYEPPIFFQENLLLKYITFSNFDFKFKINENSYNTFNIPHKSADYKLSINVIYTILSYRFIELYDFEVGHPRVTIFVHKGI